MVCGRVSNLLSAYLDRELTGADMLVIRRHLSGCAACRAEHEALGQVRRLLGALPAAEPRPGSQARFLRELTTSGHPVSRSSIRRQALQTAGLWTLARRPCWSLWAGAACAVLAGGLLFGGLRQPKPPDAVVAMIRPELESTDSASTFNPHLASYLWPGERGEITPEWQRDREPGNEPSYQLVGMRQGW